MRFETGPLLRISLHDDINKAGETGGQFSRSYFKSILVHLMLILDGAFCDTDGKVCELAGL